MMEDVVYCGNKFTRYVKDSFRMAVLFFCRCTHIHSFRTVVERTLGEYNKGRREKVVVRGDYQECDCGASRILPTRKNLFPVECE